MSGAKHTPGPWSASKINDRAAFNIFTPGQCRALLTLEPGKHNGADQRTGNVEADARLIAAAPDLLAALQDMHQVLQEAMSTGGWVPTPLQASFREAWMDVTAAIAKATEAAA